MSSSGAGAGAGSGVSRRAAGSQDGPVRWRFAGRMARRDGLWVGEVLLSNSSGLMSCGPKSSDERDERGEPGEFGEDFGDAMIAPLFILAAGGKTRVN